MTSNSGEAGKPVVSYSEADTEALGAAFAARLQPGDRVWLRGGLGSGKTAFVRGMAAGLSYGGQPSSPTFSIVHEYPGGRLPLFHFDLYRLSGWDELLDIGWEDYLLRGGVCAVEWSEVLEDGKEGYTVVLSRQNETGREIMITAPDGNEVSL